MEKDIGKISKNDSTNIVLRVDEFGGRKGLTIREYVTSERYTGFTKAGVKIPAAEMAKFKEMINSITEEDMSAVEGAFEGSQDHSAPKKSQKTLSKGSEELPDY